MVDNNLNSRYTLDYIFVVKLCVPFTMLRSIQQFPLLPRLFLQYQEFVNALHLSSVCCGVLLCSQDVTNFSQLTGLAYNQKARKSQYATYVSLGQGIQLDCAICVFDTIQNTL